MDFKPQASRRPVEPQRSDSAPQNNNPGGSPSSMQHSSHKQKKFIMIAIIVVIIVALLAGAMMWKKNKSEMGQVKKDQYQAVFLTNGQVYFGKIAGGSKDSLKLTDIYYLQVQQSVQPSGDENKNENNKDSQISMAKLGDELHGPEDAMYIQRNQILFWENLKDQGKVVQAIKSNNKK